MCDFPKNEFNVLRNYGTSVGQFLEETTLSDAFGNTNVGTVFKGVGKVRLGNYMNISNLRTLI